MRRVREIVERHAEYSSRGGTITLEADLARARARTRSVEFTEDSMVVHLTDGRSLAVPLEWFPSLRDATPEQRADWRLVGQGIRIHWEALDEDLSTRGLLMPQSLSA